jgi:hypothetical protein
MKLENIWTLKYFSCIKSHNDSYKLPVASCVTCMTESILVPKLIIKVLYLVQTFDVLEGVHGNVPYVYL